MTRRTTCEICGRSEDPTAALHHDHCHVCDHWRGWLCSACNTALTVHIEGHWSKAKEYLDRHICVPALFAVDSEEPARVPADPARVTRRSYFGNGAGSRRFVIVSQIPGYVTVEQFAAVCGVVAGTARDVITGRHTGRMIGTRFRDGGSGPVWMVNHADTLNYLSSRWEKN